MSAEGDKSDAISLPVISQRTKRVEVFASRCKDRTQYTEPIAALSADIFHWEFLMVNGFASHARNWSRHQMVE